jgi:isopenicillin-N N-acyltransferase-like protein
MGVADSCRKRWIILVLAGLVSTCPLHAQTPFRFPEGKHGKGELKYEHGIPILRVEGDPNEIGEQVAVLAVKPAKRVLDYPRNLLERLDIEGVLPILAWAGQSMLPQFPADHRKELDAIVQAGIERRPMVLGNTMFDLKQMFACSALVVGPSRSSTNEVLVGRNLDFPSLGYIQEYSLVTVYHTPGKHAFASIGFPGLVGCLSGMNDAGLCLGVLEVAHVKDGEKKFDGTGTPFALCYRRLLEECATIEEAEKLLRSMKRTTLTNLAIGDPKRAVIFEISPQSVVVREPTDGLCSCTNHFCTTQLKPAVQPDIFWTHERFDELEKIRKLPKVGIEDMHKSLHAVSVRNHTLQTMIFEPAKMRMHLAIGACPASAKDLTALDLGPLFKSIPSGKSN